jgi:hypothetical protein
MNTPMEKQPIAATVEIQLDVSTEQLSKSDVPRLLERFSQFFNKVDPPQLAKFREAIDKAVPFHNHFEKLASLLETVENFCRRTLLQALKQKYGMRFSVDDLIKLAPANAQDQTAHTLTLLQAAMLNFTDKEAAAGYFSSDSGTLPEPRKTPGRDSSQMRITAQEFAALSRELDLGGAYATYISRILKDARVKRLGAQLHRHNMKLFVYEKYFTKPIGHDEYSPCGEFRGHQLTALERLIDSKEDITTGDSFDKGIIQLHALQLFGKYSTDVTLITLRQSSESNIDSFILYVPNDPTDGFYKAHDTGNNIVCLAYQLLTKAEFRESIKSQLPIAEQHEFSLKTINDTASEITLIPLQKGLFQHLFDRYVDKFIADAKEFAVPVVNINEPAHAQRRKKMALGDYFTRLKSPTNDFINRLRTHPTDRLLRTVFNSVENWPVPERHQALIRLLDLKKTPSPADGNDEKPQADQATVTDYFEQFELTGASSGQPVYLQKKSAGSEYEVKAYIASLVFAQASLDHYEHKIYEWNDRHFIKVADSVFEVEPDPLAWRVCHPLDPHAYRPPAVYSPSHGWSVQHDAIVKQSTQADVDIDHKALEG